MGLHGNWFAPENHAIYLIDVIMSAVIITELKAFSRLS